MFLVKVCTYFDETFTDYDALLKNCEMNTFANTNVFPLTILKILMFFSVNPQSIFKSPQESLSESGAQPHEFL